MATCVTLEKGNLENMLDKDNTFIKKIRDKAIQYILPFVFAAHIFGSGCDQMNDPVQVMEQMEDRTVAEMKTEEPEPETGLSNEEPEPETRLSNNTIDENNAPEAVIGTFINESGDNLQYFIQNEDDREVVYVNEDNELVAKISFDFEEQSTYNIEVGEKNLDTDDTKFTTYEILVNNLRELGDIIILAPDNTANLSIEENREKGTIVGTFQDGEGHQVVGSGSTYFEVDGKNLVTKQPLNLEELIRQSRLNPNQEMEISVQEPEVAGQKVLKIKIVDVNEPPYAIELSNNSFSSDDLNGTEFAEIRSYDEDIEDTHTYRITEGHEFIGVSGEKLVKLQNLPSSEIDIEIEATDKGGLKWTEQFTITQTQPESITPPEEPDPPSDPDPDPEPENPPPKPPGGGNDN